MADKYLTRWTTGEGPMNGHMIFQDGQCVGMLCNAELAAEVVKVLNGAAPNDRAFICKALGHEANRIFQRQEKDYPSNVLDIVAANLREGKDTELTVPPDWMKRPGDGKSA